MAGRITLAQSAIMSTPNYLLQASLFPSVLLSKYKCGSERIPQVKKCYRKSNLWKGISKAWHHVQNGVFWSIGNGFSIRFWSDRFIPGLQTLNNYVLHPIPPELVNLTAAGASLNGQWNLQILSPLLPQDILQKLFAIIPPRQNLDEDTPTWADSCDGQFHLKDIYSQIATEVINDIDKDLWQFVWKWNGPPRIKCFPLEMLAWEIAYK
ncbi:putative ribonuclease H protein [Sesbania bispinosa]|nr:putative ribonuclease H protein [Sesbania bispinosa]